MLLETKVAGYTLIILFSPKISNMDIYIYPYISYIRKIYKYRIHYRTWLHNFICIYIYIKRYTYNHIHIMHIFSQIILSDFLSLSEVLWLPAELRNKWSMKFNWVCCRFSTIRPPCSLFRFFPFVSTSPVMGSKMVCAIIDLCQKDMANYGNSTIVYWDLWWYCRFLGNYWKTIGTSIFGFCNWIQWPLRSLDSAKPQKS